MDVIRVLAVASLALLVAACGEAPTRVEEPVPTQFYPPLPSKPRLQFLTVIGTDADLRAEKASDFRKFLVGDSDVKSWLVRPYSIAHQEGRIWVADRGRRQVVEVDLAGGTIRPMRTVQTGAMQNPFGVYVAPDGYLFVADMQLERVLAFDADGAPVHSYGEDGQFKPTAVAATRDRLYVVDIRDNEVEVLDRGTGKVITRFGTIGDPEAGLYRPTFIDLDEEGNVYVTDTLNFRVQVYDADGNHLRTIGKLGDRPGFFARPKGLAIDRNGLLYVTDTAFENVQIFDGDTGDVLLFFGTNGDGPGGTYLPVSVDIDYDNVDFFQRFADPRLKLRYVVYVANQAGNQRINVYGYGTWTGKSLN